MDDHSSLNGTIFFTIRHVAVFLLNVYNVYRWFVFSLICFTFLSFRMSNLHRALWCRLHTHPGKYMCTLVCLCHWNTSSTSGGGSVPLWWASAVCLVLAGVSALGNVQTDVCGNIIPRISGPLTNVHTCGLLQSLVEFVRVWTIHSRCFLCRHNAWLHFYGGEDRL